MKRVLLGISLILSSCGPANKTQAAQITDGERPWSGPGWYWGVYIDNEDEYRNNYQYYHNNDEHDFRRANTPERERGERLGGSDFHGGGGHR